MGTRRRRIKAAAGATLLLVIVFGGGAAVAQTPASPGTTAPLAPGDACASADALAAAHQYARAVEVYDAALAAGRVCDAGRLVQATTAARSAEAKVREGRVLLAQGDLTGARAAFEAALDLDASAPGADAALADLVTAQEELGKVRQLARAGFDAEATAALKRYLAAHPGAEVPSSLRGLSEESRWDRAWAWAQRMGQWLLLGVLVLGTAGLLFRAISARLRSDRLILGGFDAAKAPSSGEGAAAPDATGAAAAKPTAKKAPAPAAPAGVGALVAKHLHSLADDGGASIRYVTGPDEAIDLPAADTLPAQLSFIRVLTPLLPRPRGYSISGTTWEVGDRTRLGLRVQRGRPENGTIVAATVVSAPTGAEDELAGMAAAWIAYTWRQLQGDTDFALLGTSSWESYGHFLAGLAAQMATGKAADAAEPQYLRALRADPRNLGATINLARLCQSDRPELAIRYARRALDQLDDEDPDGTVLPVIARDRFVWDTNWYRAMFYLLAAGLDQWYRTLGSKDQPGGPTVVALERASHRLLVATLKVREVARQDDAPKPARSREISGATMYGFLDGFVVSARTLRAAALVEGHRFREARQELHEAAASSLNFPLSFNLACVWARLADQSEVDRADAVDHTVALLQEVGQDQSLERDLRKDPSLGQFCCAHWDKWRSVFPNARGQHASCQHG